MRFGKLGGVLAVVVGISAIGRAEPAFVTNGLVAYYPFKGDARDTSGNGNDGTNHGVKPTSDVFGNNGAAFEFNGVDSYISTPVLSQGAFTLSLMFMSQESNKMVLIGSDDEMANGYSLGLFPEHGGNLALATHSGGSFMGLVIGDQKPQLGKWYHAVCAVDGTANGTSRLYLNGQLVGSGKSFAVDPTMAWRIGVKGANITQYPFRGSIDSVRIYRRALSDQEVKDLYAYESQPAVQIPHRATATAQVVNGFVVGGVINDPGYGYTQAPAVVIVGGGGTGATATASINGGVISAITISNPGSGYTSTPTIRIASPPFMPWLEVSLKRVKVTQHVVLGKQYVLESSSDLQTWSQVGSHFIANDEVIPLEFDVDVTGRFFRIRQTQ